MKKFLVIFLFSIIFGSFSAFKIESVGFKAPPRELETFDVDEARSSGRITNGWSAFDEQFPFATYLRFKWLNESIIYYQSGAIISADFVITSAQYFVNLNTNAALYEWIEALGGSAERFSSQWQSRFVIHGYWHYPGGFDPMTYPDFALLRLSSGFQLNSRLAPIRLPRWSDANRSFIGNDALLVGWGSGSNSHLQVGNFTINFNPTVCGTPSSISLPGFFFCMSRGVNNVTSTFGDEGAPLIIREADGIYTLLGSHSMFDVANNRIFGINFSFFLNFISATVPSVPIRP